MLADTVILSPCLCFIVVEGNEIMTDARINDFKFWVLKNKDRPEVDLLPKFCTPEKLEKMITSCWNHELSSRNSFERKFIITLLIVQQVKRCMQPG